VEGGSTECADPGRVLREEAAPASAAVRFFLARPLGPASPAVHALVIMQRILLSVRPCAVQASRILLSVRPCAVQASRGDARAAGCRPCGALCARAGGRCCGDRGGAERGARPAASPPSSPPSRTKWTRLVHPSVLIGHVLWRRSRPSRQTSRPAPLTRRAGAAARRRGRSGSDPCVGGAQVHGNGVASEESDVGEVARVQGP